MTSGMELRNRGFFTQCATTMPIVGNEVRQAAAIPIKDGQICLVTSSSRKRWVIPKGIIEVGKTASEIALLEAWEEAGLTGVLQREPLGSYLYQKMGNTYHVLVYVMLVTQIAQEWPEQSMRDREWLLPNVALERLEEPGLRELVRQAVPIGPF